ncbi:hypothetical protein [Streptomyces sp. NPDC059122]|uniref:hypothetical protein n=1 Tax=Streptomyces sp. NPDC059122 TaxID=3346732 RepID=UPI003675ADBC
MSPRYVGRHTGAPLPDPDEPQASPRPRRQSRPGGIDRGKAKKVALWTALALCLAASIAVLVGLVRGFYEMDHPPGGW